ncbi:Bacterio-opsin activator HTH domain-containing protein [Natronococcus amylolyticus DSM 10524]|uniref:Bacterio-opsin activator HTH domain-containing protein n=1 Tax=Natronococcus amylolyticus DSM 10524 TaxID=1227497 RepID=L9XJG5_9EURY|nr:helix-turn-helix domain-containing protein [Natronococcus amylolyticus]ELY61737.1 Bacterio-opsin activator HTH domain-containing protein [Natronococcus amylolyticus DSM 10524]
MSLIAEYTVETPLLEEALEAVPNMILHTEAFHTTSEGEPKTIISAWGDNFHTFEQHLDIDPTIDEYEHLSDISDRRLYRITFTERGKEYFTYTIHEEHDTIILDTTGTHERLEVRARFQTRDALVAYRDACEELDVSFTLHSLYSEEQILSDACVENPYGVTVAQREAIICALEMGYFAIPRETTLEEIADELGISTQSVSQRLRRGQENIFRTTIAR